jgi:hypothetical protein
MAKVGHPDFLFPRMKQIPFGDDKQKGKDNKWFRMTGPVAEA